MEGKSDKPVKKDTSGRPRIATLGSLNQQQQQQQQSSSDDEGQAFYVGGSEKSGQQVLGPNKERADPNEVIKNVFKAAREQGDQPIEPERPELANKFSAFNGNPYQVRKISKAQRRRDRKAQLNKEKMERIEAETAELYQNSTKKLEEDRFKAILDGLGLSIYDIPSDGDCMFKAIEHQLSLRGRKTTVQELRSICASELRKRAADFLPFLIDNDSDDIMDEQGYQKYCEKIEKTKCWGGNIELQALSCALEVPIRVIQATGPSVDIGIEKYSSQQPLIISYHRHAYQLGEHYNSIIPDGPNSH